MGILVHYCSVASWFLRQWFTDTITALRAKLKYVYCYIGAQYCFKAWNFSCQHNYENCSSILQAHASRYEFEDIQSIDTRKNVVDVLALVAECSVCLTPRGGSK